MTDDRTACEELTTPCLAAASCDLGIDAIAQQDFPSAERYIQPFRDGREFRFTIYVLGDPILDNGECWATWLAPWNRADARGES